eukprot:9937809-Lingulodinium_polyedra.AAC.1
MSVPRLNDVVRNPWPSAVRPIPPDCIPELSFPQPHCTHMCSGNTWPDPVAGQRKKWPQGSYPYG